MMIPQVRQPRGAVKVNGNLIRYESFEVNNNTFYQADTFFATLPMSGQPEGLGMDYWAAVVSAEVEILVGFPKDPDRPDTLEMTTLIKAAVDDINFDMVKRTIEISGRDFTARLIDDKTTKKFQNMTSSDIVTSIAKEKGLTPVVTKTPHKAGKFHNIDHTKLTRDVSKWDLVCDLAHHDGYQVYVIGDELHYEPKPENPTKDPYILDWDDVTNAYPTFDGMGLRFNRNLTLARDVTVHVRSWNHKQIHGFTKTAKVDRSKDPVLKRAAHTAASIPIGDPQVYSFVIPNLTPEQALNKAEAFLKLITQHEMRMFATLPGDNLLTTAKAIKIQGTGVYDQIYFAESIVRRVSIEDGYTMEITAKNHNTDSYKVV